MEALLTGLASSAGVGAESLLQASRAALIDTLASPSTTILTRFMNSSVGVLEGQIARGVDTQPFLELLAFVMETMPSQELVDESFRYATHE